MSTDILKQAGRQVVADLFGVSGPAVTRWFKAEGCPRNADGTYNLASVIAWYIERERLNVVAPSPGDTGESAKWLTAYRKERALKAKLEREETEGHLVSTQEVEKAAFATGLSVQHAIMQIAPRLAPVLAGMSDTRSIENAISTELRQALEALSNA